MISPEQRIAIERITADLERGNAARQLLVIVDQMRDSQRRYFKSRDREDLVKSREIEKRVDDELRRLRRKRS